MAYLAAPFKTSGEFPIDERLVFNTKDDMVSFGKNKYSCMPEAYFAVCSEDGKFYVYNKKDHENVSGGWKLVEGTGGSSVIEEDLLVTNAWGNITAGTVIPAGTEINAVMTSALNAYVAPSFTLSSTKTLYTYPSAGAATATIANLKIGGTVGTKTITSIAFVSETNTSAVSISGYKSSFGVTSAINKTVTGNTTLTGWVSDGKTYSNKLDINFALPYYYGVSEDTNITVTDGKEIVPTSTSKKSQDNLTFKCGNGKYAWFAYDNGFNASLTAITQGATNIIEQFTTATAGYNDKTMKVYITTGTIVNDNTLSFKF